MIVLDASATIDLLLNNAPFAEAVAQRVLRAANAIAVPHLVDVEVGQVLRRLVLAGRLSEERALGALEDLEQMPMTRYPHSALARRAFELRDNLTFYDAIYMALAEALNATLVTRDAAFASVPGARARVDVV